MVYIIKIFLCYGMDHDGQGTAFNGNMASVEWSSLNDVTRRYSFRYDGLSRLSGARYTEENNENNDRYSTSYSYDKQGNIESLSRNGLHDDGTSQTVQTRRRNTSMTMTETWCVTRTGAYQILHTILSSSLSTYGLIRAGI